LNGLTHIMKRKKLIGVFISLLLGVLFYFSLPKPLFHDSLSRVLLDSEGHVLNASIAADGQWRFPAIDSIPDKYIKSLILFEDQRFYEHFGVDVRALIRALNQNWKAEKIVSGGSTLSMQVVRLSGKKNSRTYWQKIKEIILAWRLECSYSKQEILTMYASHAPFGGNVVGLEAACWRYFGRSSQQLTWADATLLAVLPNNPSLMNLGKKREALLKKRNRLLDRLENKKWIDEQTLLLSKAEPLPGAPHPLPSLTPHLQTRTQSDALPSNKYVTTIDRHIQIQTANILKNHQPRLAANHIFNGAILVADVETGKVLAYVGNTSGGFEHHEHVDIISSRRSSGSILKPFLFAAMLHEGKMLPGQLQPDIPVFINGFMPQNFSKTFDGAVPADQALIRSLNIPAVLELRQYRYEKFYDVLTAWGCTSLDHKPEHYGLSMILGGAEVTLWDITGMYASLARSLNHYFDRMGANPYSTTDIHALTYLPKNETTEELSDTPILSAASIYQTMEVLKELYRPGEETGWKQYSSTKPIAWKTGTSHGLRDGWAVGVNPDFVVGVWVGNADGEGRAGLTGTETAAPILFDVFSSLPSKSDWFYKPFDELSPMPICRASGMRASPLCTAVDTLDILSTAVTSPLCSYHKLIHLSSDRKYAVHSQCESVSKIITESRFVLPPIQEYFYAKSNSHYVPLPPYRKDCENPTSEIFMDLIYPKHNTTIHLPRQLNGDLTHVLFEAVHRLPQAQIFWYLDGEYIGVTQKKHQLPVMPTEGIHHLSLVDSNGESLNRTFKVL